jgi:formamidopyrimidine-DNA glycosylase
MHFGMTGRPHYYKNEEDRPKFGHFELSFENGFHFAFENKQEPLTAPTQKCLGSI